jgi:hypothetical protein
MSEKRIIDADEVQKYLDKLYENHEAPYKMLIKIMKDLKALSRPVTEVLDQISSKSYGADGVGLTHDEVDTVSQPETLQEQVLKKVFPRPLTEQPIEPVKTEAIERPKIVCFCGSTRFKDELKTANIIETLKGNIVLSIGLDLKTDVPSWTQEERDFCKLQMDELHKRKIDLADEILVLNVGGYIGESTRSEIDYAIAHNKPVRYLKPNSQR